MAERAGCASRTSVLQHSIPRPQTCPHQSETQQPPSLLPVRPGSRGEGGTVPANPPHPSRLCSVLAPGQEGLAAQHAQ